MTARGGKKVANFIEAGATCQGQKLDWCSTGQTKCIGDISHAAAKPELRVSRLEGVCDHSLKYVAKRMPAGVLLAASPADVMA